MYTHYIEVPHIIRNPWFFVLSNCRFLGGRSCGTLSTYSKIAVNFASSALLWSVTSLRPLLRAVENADNMDDIAGDLVDHNVRKRREHEARASPLFYPDAHGTGTPAARTERCKFHARARLPALARSQTNSQ